MKSKAEHSVAVEATSGGNGLVQGGCGSSHIPWESPRRSNKPEAQLRVRVASLARRASEGWSSIGWPQPGPLDQRRLTGSGGDLGGRRAKRGAQFTYFLYIQYTAFNGCR